MRVARDDDIADKIVVLEAQYALLATTSTVLDDAMKVAMIIATWSDHREYELMITSLNTMKEEDTKGYHIWTLLIEEGERLQASPGSELQHDYDMGQLAQVRRRTRGNAFGKRQLPSNDRRCYYCQKKGHLSRNCQARVKNQGETGPPIKGNSLDKKKTMTSKSEKFERTKLY